MCVPSMCSWQCRLRQGMTFILACTVLQYTHDLFGCLIALLHKIVSLLWQNNDLCLCSKIKDNKNKECCRNLKLNVKMLEIYHHHQCLHEIFVVVSNICSYVKKWSADLFILPIRNKNQITLLKLVTIFHIVGVVNE